MPSRLGRQAKPETPSESESNLEPGIQLVVECEQIPLSMTARFNRS